jgi:divalent metal cation (Fe/Co/Zn/Cd) transporter
MDAIGSILIAIYIFFMAYTAFKESTLVLIDAIKNPELQHEMTQHIEGKFKVQGKRSCSGRLGRTFQLKCTSSLTGT